MEIATGIAPRPDDPAMKIVTNTTCNVLGLCKRLVSLQFYLFGSQQHNFSPHHYPYLTTCAEAPTEQFAYGATKSVDGFSREGNVQRLLEIVDLKRRDVFFGNCRLKAP